MDSYEGRGDGEEKRSVCFLAGLEIGNRFAEAALKEAEEQRNVASDPDHRLGQDDVVLADSPKKGKKPKGLQLDDTYLEYNEAFIAAAKLLQSYSARWNKLLNDNSDLHDDVIGQINSAVGQAKLLLDSKLPQFAELLYFYLSRNEDPSPVLPCDLEGWWAVAIISVGKVRDLFEELAALQGNSWVKPEPPKPKTLPARTSKKSPIDSKAPTNPKPRANAGLRAFLAQKRKEAISAPAENQQESNDGYNGNNAEPTSPSPSLQLADECIELTKTSNEATAVPEKIKSFSEAPDPVTVNEEKPVDKEPFLLAEEKTSAGSGVDVDSNVESNNLELKGAECSKNDCPENINSGAVSSDAKSVEFEGLPTQEEYRAKIYGPAPKLAGAPAEPRKKNIKFFRQFLSSIRGQDKKQGPEDSSVQISVSPVLAAEGPKKYPNPIRQIWHRLRNRRRFSRVVPI